jgi:hypothetical protein
MSVSVVTALEIFTNPNDLFIYISQSEENGNYTYCIRRGPQHSFKILLTSGPTKYRMYAIINIEAELLSIYNYFMDTPSLLLDAILISSQRRNHITSLVLTQTAIDKIIQELKATGEAKTYLRPR